MIVFFHLLTHFRFKPEIIDFLQFFGKNRNFLFNFNFLMKKAIGDQLLVIFKK